METTYKKYNKEEFVEIIKERLPKSVFLKSLLREYPPCKIILREFTQNDILHVIIEGTVSIVKLEEKGSTKIANQGPGEFLGLLSFQTGEPVFQSARALTKTVTIAINRNDYELLQQKYPKISKILNDLIFANLSDRYRRVVMLHLEVEKLSENLKQEQAELKKTIRELRETRNMLITQEKMAVLGELTAGLAHEINNPASALLRSVDFLLYKLPQMLEDAGRLNDKGLLRYFFESGQKRVFSSSQEHRETTRNVADSFPGLKRSQIRVLADMNEDALEKIRPFARKEKHRELFELYMEAFQAGIFVNGIKISASRIEHLVKSLKSFSRHDKGLPVPTDLRQGIEETLLLVGNRLKNITIEKSLPEIPYVNCRAGEINQVFTNIIINACDAMNDEGSLYISCGAEAGDVWIKIADSGPGVPASLREKIFDSSFTTKTAGGDFGLGLGLAISKGIIEKHNGTLTVGDRTGGGAEFTITLPSISKNQQDTL